MSGQPNTDTALDIFQIIKGLLIFLQTAESLFKFPWREVTLQWKYIYQKQIPSPRYCLKNKDQKIRLQMFLQFVTVTYFSSIGKCNHGLLT